MEIAQEYLYLIYFYVNLLPPWYG